MADASDLCSIIYRDGSFGIGVSEEHFCLLQGGGRSGALEVDEKLSLHHRQIHLQTPVRVNNSEAIFFFRPDPLPLHTNNVMTEEAEPIINSLAPFRPLLCTVTGFGL